MSKPSDIVALRNEKGSYNQSHSHKQTISIVALRNEKGSYNLVTKLLTLFIIVALRNEKGSYNSCSFCGEGCSDCSTAK